MLARFYGNEKGTIAVLAAFVIPIFVGFVGIGVETSYWYFNKLKVQNSADAAAYAAAVLLRANAAEADMIGAGVDAAQKSGFNTGVGTFAFNTPPTSGDFTSATAVEATLSESVPRFFTALFVDGTVPMSGRAVALIGNARPACILALDPAADAAVMFSGSSTSVLEDCDVAANSVSPSAVAVQGSADLDLDCIASVGGVSVSGSSNLTLNECEQPIENTEEFPDPYASTPEPTTLGACQPQNVFSGPPSAVHNIGPGIYCGGLSLNRTVNLAPGVYIIDGGSLSMTSTAVVHGSDVTFFLTDDAGMNINGSAEVQITAPTTGPYAGIAVFADNDNDGSLTYNINGNSDSFITGAIYSPSGTVVLNGSSTSGGGCTQIVARLVRVNGGAGLGSNCGPVGTNPMWSARAITLVE